jgi:malonyl CoA-acyl carrier protein transacylase
MTCWRHREHGLTPANVNAAAGQIVAAGTMDELAAFAADPWPGPGCGRCR